MGEKDKSELEIIENCRKYIVEKLKKFKESVQAENADDIGRAIYDALIDFHVDKNLISIADSLIRLHMNSLAKEQGRIWDLVMYSINQLADIEKNEKISMNEYADLLNIIISNEELGVIPQGLDNVIFATADRVRLSSIKYVFILGANEGEFPLTYVNSGLLTENDRKKLSDKDMKLYSSTDVINIQEKYFAYMAASVASDKLTVCYQGECKNAAPSTLIYSLKEIFPKIHVDKHSYLSNLDLIESRQSAFELLSEHLDNQDEFYESLKQYFINDDNYVSIQKIAANEDFHIKNKETSVELFDKDMYLSASRVEDYFNCPFRYFCKFGLHAQPLIKAEMNSMETGTIIHYVLENFLSNFGNETLQGLSEQDIKKGVDVLLNRYLLNKMGDTKELNSRFKYKLLRLSKMLYRVVMCLKDEFAQSNFKSVGFETEIDNHGDIKPKLIQLDDGGSVSLTGIVDRIDILEKDNDRYVRIVDYKSGTKEFELSDILYGLNLQMFVYLFTICADKTCEYSAIPAGVLYMHAARSVYSVDSADVNESISKREKKEFKMQGLLLYDDEHQILKDMEANLEERFIPVKVKNGDIVGSIASLGELGQISRKIDKLIKEMGENLHSGKIEQHPINGKNHDKTCEFCDYSEVCAFTKSVKVKEKKEYSREEVFDKIGEKGNSN